MDTNVRAATQKKIEWKRKCLFLLPSCQIIVVVEKSVLFYVKNMNKYKYLLYVHFLTILCLLVLLNRIYGVFMKTNATLLCSFSLFIALSHPWFWDFYPFFCFHTPDLNFDLFFAHNRFHKDAILGPYISNMKIICLERSRIIELELKTLS